MKKSSSCSVIFYPLWRYHMDILFERKFGLSKNLISKGSTTSSFSFGPSRADKVLWRRWSCYGMIYFCYHKRNETFIILSIEALKIVLCVIHVIHYIYYRNNHLKCLDRHFLTRISSLSSPNSLR